MFVYLNNRLVPALEAKISVYDRGFAYGDSLFETVKVLKGRPVFLPEHLERLRKGMEAAGFGSLPAGHDQLAKQALDLAEKNGIELGRLRIQVTRGTPPEPSGPDPGEGLTPTLLVTLEAFAGVPPEHYENGVACALIRTHRGRYASVKSAGLLGSILARREAHAAGAWEAILTSGHGRLLEGVYTNIFFLAGSLLLTASHNDPILPGIIRQKVIDEAPALGLSCEFHAPRLEELGLGAASAFLTSSLLGVCPVSEIDGIRLQPDPGPILALRKRVEELEEESIRV